MSDEDKEQNNFVDWQLKYLTNNAGSLKPSDLEWAIRMEEAYTKQGFLTNKQRDVLSDIYKRY